MSGVTDLRTDAELPAVAATTRALPGGWAAAGAVLCGVFYFLAFPGVDLWPLGFVALVPLRLALLGQTPKRAFWLGWLSGVVMITLGFYWMVDMMKQFSGFSAPICMLLLFIVNVFEAGRMGLFAWLFARGVQRFPKHQGLLFLSALVTSELTFPVLFFWSFGATLHNGPGLHTGRGDGRRNFRGNVGRGSGQFRPRRAGRAGQHERRPVERQGDVAHASSCRSWPAIVRSIAGTSIKWISASAAAPKAEVGLVQADMKLDRKAHSSRRGTGCGTCIATRADSPRSLASDLVICEPRPPSCGAMMEDKAAAIVPRAFAAAPARASVVRRSVGQAGQ